MRMRRVVNWSGTHQVTTSSFVEPETTAELEALVADAHSSGRSIRPLGSALSPNGIAFSSQGMVGLAQMDRIVSVDKDKKQVRARNEGRRSGR
jgi:L-galactono-1,4-lactone dehydrogenase